MALKASILSLVGAALLAAVTPAAAHHSIAAEFDTSKPISFTGTVKEVEWTNPHTYTRVEVKNPDGTMTLYRVEGGPPNALFRQGWRKDSLKAGETVTVSGLRAKNANSMNVGQATITTSDGRTMFGQTNAANPNR
jgi:DNA/RNA endonuclease YhcR with UshA esterase domain